MLDAIFIDRCVYKGGNFEGFFMRILRVALARIISSREEGISKKKESTRIEGRNISLLKK